MVTDEGGRKCVGGDDLSDQVLGVSLLDIIDIQRIRQLSGIGHRRGHGRKQSPLGETCCLPI